jgi:hypothetical protein
MLIDEIIMQIQIHWVTGICPSSGILKTRKCDVSEMGFYQS